MPDGIPSTERGLGRPPEVGRGASSKSVMLVRHLLYDFDDCLLLISMSGLMLYWFENDEFPRVEIRACREIEDFFYVGTCLSLIHI